MAHHMEADGRSRARLLRLSRPGPALLAALIALAITLVWTLSETGRPFYYDSRNYWSLGNTFVVHHHFSLLNYHDGLRGYLFPAICYVLSRLAAALSVSDSVIVRIFNAGVFTSIGALLIPAVAELSWPERRWGVGRRLLVTMVLMAMWSGFVLFPLTDFPAIALALLAIISCSDERTRQPGWMALAGLATAAALNLRPAYELLLPAVVGLILWAWWRGRHCGRTEHRRRLGCALVAVAMFALVSLPQTLVMHRYFHAWSIIPGSQAGLASLQYTEGVELQLYDTYVGTAHPPTMYFFDPGGVYLLSKIPGGQITSLGELVRLSLEHPQIMGLLFARHVINGLDQRYTDPYIAHLRITDWWSRIAGFGLVLVALGRVLWPPARRAAGRLQWRYPIALLVSGATAIAAAVEQRFLLPVAVLSYAVVLTPGWRRLDTTAALRRRSIVYGTGVLAMLAALAMVILVVTNATSHHLS